MVLVVRSVEQILDLLRRGVEYKPAVVLRLRDTAGINSLLGEPVLDLVDCFCRRREFCSDFICRVKPGIVGRARI